MIVDPPHPLELALQESDRFFMHTSSRHRAARALDQRLRAAGIDYAICGAFAVAAYGHERFTRDVDVLVTREGLARFKAEWLGRGYLERVPGGRGLRDTENGVDLDFLVSGDFPGDGRPKPVAFPDPQAAGVEAGELRVLTLPRLIELKLASGMSAPHRLQDLADVLALIRVNTLARDLAAALDPWVRDKYEELWQAAQTAPGE